MYVRVQILSVDPAKARQIVHFAEEDVIPKLKRLPGFRRYTAAGDLVGGRAITITEWDTREQAQGQLAALNFGQETNDVGIEVDAIYVYEVVASVENVRASGKDVRKGHGRRELATDLNEPRT